MKKYVIWDFNGTILDDLELCLNILNQMLLNQDKQPIDLKTYKEIFGFPIKEYYTQAGLSFENQTFNQLSLDFIKAYQPKSLNEKLHEGVIHTLKTIQSLGLKNVLLSASETNNLIEQVKHFEIDQYFDFVIGTDNVNAIGKVERGLEFMHSNNIDPKQVIYIGDTIHDYEVATQMGVQVVLFDGGHQSYDRLKPLKVSIIHQINDIITYITQN